MRCVQNTDLTLHPVARMIEMRPLLPPALTGSNNISVRSITEVKNPSTLRESGVGTGRLEPHCDLLCFKLKVRGRSELPIGAALASRSRVVSEQIAGDQEKSGLTLDL